MIRRDTKTRGQGAKGPRDLGDSSPSAPLRGRFAAKRAAAPRPLNVATSHITHHTSPLTRNSQLATRNFRAFTLIELLVVIGIAALMLAIIAPVWSSLAKGSRIGGAKNTVSAAVNAARILNKRLGEGDKGGAGEPFPEKADYSGTAVIFTPSGEARFVFNDQAAQNQSGASLEPNLNGYADITGIDYLNLPAGTGIVGVTSNGSGVVFYTPPFALRFNQFGQLATDQPDIYYDGNGDGYYNTGLSRSDVAPYDPTTWDFRGGGENVQRTEIGIYKLPFEKIETVNAVIVYSIDAFKSAGNSLSDVNAAKSWLEQNGTPMYFSPMSGLVLRKQ